MDKDTAQAFHEAMAACGVSEAQIRTIHGKAYEAHRRIIGSRIIAVIEEYYRRTDQGERVSMRDLARAAGVNEASLRQSKVRYDQEHRKDKHNGMRNARLT